MKDRMTEQDWLDEMAKRLVESAMCVMYANEGMSAEMALEIALSKSCSGPRTIAEAKRLLGIQEG
jgi:hypothetical protein